MLSDRSGGRDLPQEIADDEQILIPHVISPAVSWFGLDRKKGEDDDSDEEEARVASVCDAGTKCSVDLDPARRGTVGDSGLTRKKGRKRSQTQHSSSSSGHEQDLVAKNKLAWSLWREAAAAASAAGDRSSRNGIGTGKVGDRPGRIC